MAGIKSKSEADGQNIDENPVLSFINEQFCDDVKNLSKARVLYDQIKRENDEIRLQVSLVSSEAPGKIDSTLNQAKDALQQAKSLTTQKDNLVMEIDEHSKTVEDKVQQLTALSDQVKELERYVSYLEWIARLEDLSSNIQTALIINSVERSVSYFAEMSQLVENLQTSHCLNLIKFGHDTIMFWYKILKDKLVSEFEEILKLLGWPFVGASSMPSPPQDVSEHKERMKVLFGQLVKLQLPEGMAPDSQTNHPLLAQIPGWKPILMPIQLLIKPLKKRFHYHFFGNKQTNSIDKPEWFFTQILSWIRDHRDFLRTTVQPMMKEANLAHVDCQVEFIRGLLVSVMERMAADIPDLMFDEHQFSHMIDEALAFDKELQNTYDYPSTQPRCLQILTEKDAFDKWIMIERKFALEKMDAMLSSTSAWQSQYKDIPDVDELKVPECGEGFMTLMLTITERYKSLPSPAHRIKFMDLQLELLDDFRIRLLQVMKEVSSTPTSPVFCAIFNTINYVIDVARQWNELPFFVQLQYYRCAPLVSRYATPMAGSPRSPLSPDGDVSLSITPSKDKLQISMDFDESLLDKIEGTVFDETIKLYEHIKSDMMKNLVGDVMMDVKARSRPYRKDRWICLSSQKDLVGTGLSPSACEMFMVLRDWLHTIQQLLSKGLYRIFWQALAEDLNKFIYKDVILENHFNDGGAAQLQYDMNRNLFPLFGQYSTKPENYFKDVKEGLIILNLKPGSAMLLKEVLNTALHKALIDPHIKVQDPIAALHDVTVYKLSPEDVELVLSLRTDLV